MQTSHKRALSIAVLLAVAAGAAWFGTGKPGDARSNEALPEEARSLLGCWNILSSKDLRYPARHRLCLHPNRVVVLTPEGSVEDGWEVSWSRDTAGWRLTVPKAQTEGADVHFMVSRADDGGLSFRSGAGWVNTTLGEREPLSKDAVLERLRACRRCVGEAIDARPAVKQLIGSAPYSLQACTLLARTEGEATCDMYAVEGGQH